MILLGVLTILVGVKEINPPSQLTRYAAWSSIGLGAFILFAGLGHFRAPHKSFLISIPILITFIIHVYCLGLFYNVKNLTLFLGGHILAVIMILVLSYLGYRKMRAAT